MTKHIEGTILRGEQYEPLTGRIVITDGTITNIEHVTEVPEQIITPAFVNAHTHVGDSVAKEAAVRVSLEEAVAPPNSLKHRRLAAADREELVTAMRQTLRFMRRTGTVSCLDFRESGQAGARALRDAAAPLDIDPFIFGSGDPLVLDIADGYGASGANDDDYTAERAATRERNDPFAIHAGEPDASDIYPALNLDPDLLIHMVHARQEHLDRVADESIPITVCPRANAVLNVGRPPVRELLNHTTVALGTDNVMLNSPTMFREMAYTAKQFDVTAREVLRMATTAGAEIAGLNCGVIEEGKDAKLCVVDASTTNLTGAHDPVRTVVRRASHADVRRTILREPSS